MAIFLVEIVGSRASKSMSLEADAWHVLTDAMAFLVGIVALLLPILNYHKFNKDERDQFSNYIQILLLLVIAVWIPYEAFDRYLEPKEVAGKIVFIVALFGGVCNFIQIYFLERTAGEDKGKNHFGISSHVRSDLYQSVGVVASGLIIWIMSYFDFSQTKIWSSRIDIAFSVGIALWILWQVRKMIKGEHHHH